MPTDQEQQGGAAGPAPGKRNEAPLLAAGGAGLPTASPRGLAATWTEAIGIGAVVMAGIVLASMGVASVRSDLKRQQVWELLARLDAALDAYHGATGAWPLVAAADRSPSNDGDDSNDAQPLVELLAGTQAALLELSRINPVLRVRPAEGVGFGTFRDAWGTRLHCLTSHSPDVVDRQAVAANGGKPIFVSASEDARFLGPDGSGAADNLRSDELPRGKDPTTRVSGKSTEQAAE